jgi:hypothetical protein
MEFRNIELVIESGTELRDLDRARSLLDKLSLVVDSHKEDRNAAGFTFMNLGVKHCMGGDGRDLAVLSPCSTYAVFYEGFNNLSPNDYHIKFSICGTKPGSKNNDPRVNCLRIIPKDKSEMVLDLAYRGL